jgi:hypothetical protein
MNGLRSFGARSNSDRLCECPDGVDYSDTGRRHA